MDIGIVATRYARALIAFANESGKAEKTYRRMERITNAFFRLPALHEALANPVVPDEKKVELLLAASMRSDKAEKDTEKKRSGKDAKSSVALLQRFFGLVVKNKRADLMPFIATSFLTLYRKEHHLIKGELVVPKPVSGDLVQRLQQAVESRTGGKVDFDLRIDESIGGGFILSYDTYRLDASMRTRLANIHRSLIN